MNADDAREFAFLIAPGFLSLKLFQLFGAQRERSEWEWTIWAVVTSLAIDVVTRDPALKLVVALLVGVTLVLAWRLVSMQGSVVTRWMRRELTNSAWDHTLDEATRRHYPIELVTEKHRYFGRLATYAREENKSQAWVYLTYLSRDDGTGWKRLERTEGVLIHADRLLELRVIRPEGAGPTAIARSPVR